MDGTNVIAKISFGGVLYLRSQEGKRGYKGPLLAAYPGDLIISKIRVSQGSLCIVPADMDHLAVSPEYPVHVADFNQINLDFLRLAIGNAPFRSRLSALRSGNTSKARIKPADFAALTIPLPNLAEQDALVATHSSTLGQAERLEREAQEVEAAGLAAFEDALGLTPPPPLPERPVFIAQFRDLERWSHEGALRASPTPPGHRIPWPVVKLGSQLLEIRHGCSLSPTKQPTALKVIKISAVTKGYLDLTQQKPIADQAILRTQFSLRAGDVLMCRTNGTLAYVGMSALVEVDILDTIFPDKVIRVRPNQLKMDSAFLWGLMQVPQMRQQLESAARTAVGNYAIGGRDIAKLNVPLPPVEQQRALIRDLKGASAQAKTQHSRAAALRQSARSAFEAALFQPCLSGCLPTMEDGAV